MPQLQKLDDVMHTFHLVGDMANHNEVNSEPHTMGRLFKVS